MASLSRALAAAARAGDNGQVRRLLRRGADPCVCEPGELGQWALEAACSANAGACVRLLLPRVAGDVVMWSCALDAASAAGAAECVAQLIAARPDTGLAGEYALDLACERNHPEVVRLLLPHVTADGLAFGLGAACERGAAECARLLLAHGAGPDWPTEGGATALERACRGGSLECARLVLATGAPMAGAFGEARAGARPEGGARLVTLLAWALVRRHVVERGVCFWLLGRAVERGCAPGGRLRAEDAATFRRDAADPPRRAPPPSTRR